MMASPPAEDPDAAGSAKRSAEDEPGIAPPPPKVRTVTAAANALSRNETVQQGRVNIRDEQLAALGMAPAQRDFTKQDMKAWAKDERSMYSSQCQLHGPAHASAFMRRYFKENEGKPLPPAPPPRSAYAIFRAERFAEIGCNANGSKRVGGSKKNFSKQVGAEWKQLSEEQQQPYEDTWTTKAEEHGAATAVYEAALEAWAQQKERAAQ